MKSSKTLFAKIFTPAIAMAFLFATGCASVADPNIDVPETEETSETTITQPVDLWNTNGDDMDPIIDPPPTGN